jgi:hypothetical protein
VRMPEIMNPDHRHRIGAESLAAARHVADELAPDVLAVAVLPSTVPYMSESVPTGRTR